MEAVELSVVVPVYSCEASLRELHRRLTESLEWTAGSYELIFVEDRGPDASWGVLREITKDDPHVRAFRLSRNFGQHAAITAGLSMSRGRWTVVMDCDLQDPPEEIHRLYAKAGEGYDATDDDAQHLLPAEGASADPDGLRQSRDQGQCDPDHSHDHANLARRALVLFHRTSPPQWI